MPLWLLADKVYYAQIDVILVKMEHIASQEKYRPNDIPTAIHETICNNVDLTWNFEWQNYPPPPHPPKKN